MPNEKLLVVGDVSPRVPCCLRKVTTIATPQLLASIAEGH
jgi:hypothetical protein